MVDVAIGFVKVVINIRVDLFNRVCWGSSKLTSWVMGKQTGSASACDCALVRGMAK